jgi:hypothetical protein
MNVHGYKGLGILKPLNKFAIDYVFQVKGQFARKGQPPFGENAFSVTQVIDQKIRATRLKDLKLPVFEGCKEVVIENGVLAYCIDADLVQRSLFKIDAVSPSKDIAVGNGLKTTIHP